jgi:hypothetical protein
MKKKGQDPPVKEHHYNEIASLDSFKRKWLKNDPIGPKD